MPTWLDYMGIANQQRYAAQDQQMKMQMFQQAQQDRQRQQAAMQAAGNALPQLLPSGQVSVQPQMPPPPQAPMPGQPSQPMMQPGQMPPPPQQPQNGGGIPLPPGQPGQQPPPLPPGGPQGQMPPGGLPPFRPMPTSPPPQAQQAAPSIAPPPQPAPQPQQGGGPLSLESAVKVLQDQGLSGADLMAGLQQLTPLLDQQAKQQANMLQAKFNQEFKMAQLNQTEEYHKGMLESHALDRTQRAQHEDALLGIQQQRLGLENQRLGIERQKLAAQTGGGVGGAPAPDIQPDAQGNLPPAKPVAGYSAQAIDALAKDYAVRGPTALGGFGNRNLSPVARAEIVNRAAAINALSGTNIATNKAQYAADTAGARVNATQAAKVDASANALVQPGGIGDQYQEQMDALNRTGIPFANDAQMAVLRKANDPRVAAFDAAQNAVVSEAAQILGRGSLTVNSMEEARRVVNGWKTSASARAGLAQMKREAATTVKASSEEVTKSARSPKGAAASTPGIPAGWTVTEH